MTIPLRLRTRPLEPAHGALLRLCARNGRHVVSSFATSLGVQLRRALAGHDVARITDLAGLSCSTTAWWSPVVSVTDRVVTIAGEELSLGDWSVARRRHCPECLRQDVAAARDLGLPADWVASHRSHWDVHSIVACPVHGAALVDVCPFCGVSLGWSDARRLICPNCRGDLTANSALLDDPLGRYVSARLGVSQSQRPKVLDDLSLRQAVRLCGKLGRAGLDGPPERNSAGVPTLAVAREGFRRASIGARGLDDVLNRLIASRGCNAPDGLGGAYGWLHNEWLGTEDPTAWVYKETLRRHAVAHGVIAAHEERLGALPPPTINMKQAATRAGVAVQRMRRLLDDVGALPPGSRRGVPFALDPGVVGLAAKRRSAIRRAAGEVLDVGRTALRGLAEAGMVDITDEERFRASAATLLASVEQQICAGAAPSGTAPLPVSAVAAAVPISRILKMLTQNCIPAWRSSKGVGLSAVVVQVADLCPLRVRPDGYTCGGASRILGLHEECVRALIRDGTLARGSDGLVACATLERFTATYVVGAELARSMSCSPAHLLAKLAKSGVQPAWPLTTHRQAIFKRSDLSPSDQRLQ